MDGERFSNTLALAAALLGLALVLSQLWPQHGPVAHLAQAREGRCP